MGRMTGRVLAGGLAGCGAVACLVLSGALPGAPAAPARAAAAAVAAVARSARPADTIIPDTSLSSVSAVSASDAWAVGDGIMHWNGARWSRYLTLPGGLYGVAALSAGDAWAVGTAYPQTLAMHWNGRSWTRVRTPALKGGGVLYAVAATSSASVWAVGSTGASADPGSAGTLTLIEHWNGTRWARIASPGLPGAVGSMLASVTATGADYAWAVGSSAMPDGTTKTLTMVWNGRRWQLAASPTPGTGAYLLGVTASWTHNIWAVGSFDPTDCQGDGCAPYQTLVMHWNGTRWKVLPSPDGSQNAPNRLLSIAAVTRANIWAVGWNVDGLIVHWNGHAWS